MLVLFGSYSVGKERLYMKVPRHCVKKFTSIAVNSVLCGALTGRRRWRN